MPYRAHVRIDYIEGVDSNECAKLIAAFKQAGWNYAERKALVVETEDLRVVLRGLDILARQIPFAGAISGLLFDVQRSDDFAVDHPYGGAPNHPNALRNVRKRPSPT
jgi:hypothetical protein